MKLICLNVALFEENNDKLKAFLKEQNAENNFEVLNSDVSDHLPLILDFEI